ncbi:CoA-binding protein [Candidatus Wolfebacteria bacterium]|nr:CoA-binding protein [Candidatus Wolfebacteria bacterium]
MAILVDKNTRVIIQGITGAEGSRACKEMIAYGTNVVAGITPKKGGQSVEGVPVFNTVKDAISEHPADISLIVVPPQFVKDAATEALGAGIKLINILTEYVPARDSSVIVALARKLEARIIGPASVGIISPGKGKVGSIGSGEIKNVFTPGPIGIISKSGGMVAELAVVLSRTGWGQSTAIGIGGDIIAGSDYVDLLELFEKDDETKAVVMFGEVGGTYEEDAAEYIKSGKFTKPVVAIVGGRFADKLKQGVVLGHAGAIVSKGKGGYDSKVGALKDAGVLIAETIEQIPDFLRLALKI